MIPNSDTLTGSFGFSPDFTASFRAARIAITSMRLTADSDMKYLIYLGDAPEDHTRQTDPCLRPPRGTRRPRSTGRSVCHRDRRLAWRPHSGSRAHHTRIPVGNAQARLPRQS